MVRKPQMILVKLYEEDAFEMTISFDETVATFIKMVCHLHKLEISPNSLALYHDDQLLPRRKCLFDLNIETGAVLSIKPDDDAGDELDPNEDMNIYEEGDGEEFVTYEDANKSAVATCTLNKLIELLTNPDNYNLQFMQTFFFTYTSFTTAEVVLAKLAQRYNTPTTMAPEKSAAIQVRVCVFISNWLDMQFRELPESFLERLTHFIEGLPEKDRRDSLLAVLTVSLFTLNVAHL